MTIGEFLLALLLGLLVAGVLASLGRYRTRPGQTAANAFLFFFLIAFFFILAAGVGAEPYGPPVAGVFWGPFLFWALIIGLLLAAVASAEPQRTDPGTPVDRPTGGEAGPAEVTATAFGAFFFILLLALVIPVVVAAFA